MKDLDKSQTDYRLFCKVTREELNMLIFTLMSAITNNYNIKIDL